MSKLTMATGPELAARAVELVKKLGGEEAEAFYTETHDLTVEVVRQEIETMKVAVGRGIGLRAFVDSRMGFSYTVRLDQQGLEEAAQKALANARLSSPDRYWQLPAPAGQYPEVKTYDPQIEKVPLEDKVELAKEMERAALACDPRVRVAEGSAYQDSAYQVVLANSRGITAAYRGAYCGCYAMIAAQEDGDTQGGFEMSYSLHFDLDPQKVGQKAAFKAVRMLKARPAASKKAPVVLDPYVAVSFLGVLSAAFSAEAVQKKSSLLAGKEGRQVASPLVTLVDDGALPEGLASAPFDGEGVPTGRHVLLDKGVVQGFLYNSYTAAKAGTASTGNAKRAEYTSTPEVGTTNFFLQAGDISQQELLGSVADGFYVTEIMGIHNANPISGDFSVGAAGLWIDHGELAYPVRGVAIAGNILELFNSVDAVADDLTFFAGRGAPTVKIAQMSISGR